MGTFFSEEELKSLGIKRYGSNVLISRNAMIYHPDKLEIGDNVRIDDFCTISGSVVFGDYIHVSQFCSFYGGDIGIEVGDFTGFSSRIAVYAISNDYSGESMNNPMTPAKFRPGDVEEKVVVGRHSLIGVASIILPGVEIGEGCAVGAMTLCNKSIEPWGIYAGIPAKRVKERSRKVLEFEEKLKEELKMSVGGVTPCKDILCCHTKKLEMAA